MALVHKSGELQSYAFGVAQISNLLYRRIPFGRPSDHAAAQEFPRQADWKSAIQQVGNLRYPARVPSAFASVGGAEDVS